MTRVREYQVNKLLQIAKRLSALFVATFLAAGACLLLDRAEGSAEEEAWRPILPQATYRELAQREADLIRRLLDEKSDEHAIYRARFGAVLIAALTMSTKEEVSAADLRATRQATLMLARSLQASEPLANSMQLAMELPFVKPGFDKGFDLVEWRSLTETPKLMRYFLPKHEGGDGIHADLQSDVRLKGSKNGILEKIRSLTTNELTVAEMNTESKELELFGYRNSVIGSLNYYLVPSKMKANKTPGQWRALALEMRDHSLGLAKAARQRDTKAVLKASIDLRSACSRCHNVF
jgi:hypothetical protein